MNSLFWLVQALGYLALVFFIIPPRYIRRLLLFGLLAGGLYTVVVQSVAVNVLSLWLYPPDGLMIAGVPLFFIVNWFLVTLLYGYLLLRHPKGQLWIVAFFVAWATASNVAAVASGHVVHLRWSTVHTLMFGIFSHVVLLYFLRWLHGVRELGADEDMVRYSFGMLRGRD